MLTAEGQKLNPQDDKDQGLFLVLGYIFTLPDSNPNQGDQQFTLK